MPATHGQSDFIGLEAYCNRNHHHNDGDRFGRMFPQLAPLFTDPRVLERLGRPGGPMDAGSPDVTAQTVPVGFVFFGQFVDHDITLDVTTSLDTVNSAHETRNARTPTLDLDCIYGMGPEAQPYLYHASGDFKGVKLITGADVNTGPHAADDLARVGDVALIGDFRNDENRIVSQIQLAMIRFHNRLCDDLSSDHSGKDLYEEARRLTMWHYQWCVVHDFLNHICGEGVVSRILSEGRRHYMTDTPFIPVEFSVAAYRFGHAMVPMKVQTQQGGSSFELFGTVLGKGFSPVTDARAVADMHELFETFEGRTVQRAGRMDAKMASDLLSLPARIDPAGQSLATRNMIRGQSFLLPSGEAVAREMGRPDAEIEQVSDAARAEEADLNGGTPLWYYILKEAELIGRENLDGTRLPGEGLGPVGATMVAETIIGLIESDGRSWLGSNRNWRPETRADNPAVELSSVGHLLTYT
ncbi:MULTISPECIES: heme peroxidase family protein [unclassified Roseovarius]|uniref:peroxidase family protein n=1 Tax=unclassified Roseovarius TaxID=2614913 RepID=UPI00273FC59B|nr:MULTISPECIES: heme peroxidase family protein [unclassified Roseovarius]